MTLDDEDRKTLCGIARAALGAAVRGEKYEPKDPERPALEERRGCFVTLKLDGQLRGCLGCFTSQQPLYQTVAVYAAYSAMEDPRFVGRRIGPADLEKVEVDISALSPLETCDAPEKIIPGVHGIFVSKGSRSGCFLPQVAIETGWGVEDFWGHCCRDKAGLDWNAWREPGVTVMTFTAEVFDC